jgi:hypothetical protein
MKYNFEQNLSTSDEVQSTEALINVLNKHNLELEQSLLDLLIKYQGYRFNDDAKKWLPDPDSTRGHYRLDWLVNAELIENRFTYGREFEEENHYYFVDCLLNLISTETTMIYIGYAGEYKGKLYTLDYQLYEYDDDYSKMLVKIGDSLEDVFSRLITYDELPDEWK